MTRLLIGRDIWDYASGDTLVAAHKELRMLRPSSDSKSVPGVSINWGKKIIVRVKRAAKEMTEAEVALIALEYQRPLEEITELLTARKIRIVNANGEQTNVRAKAKRKAGSGRRKKANANNADAPEREAASVDKLLEPRADTDVPEKSVLLAGDGTK